MQFRSENELLIDAVSYAVQMGYIDETTELLTQVQNGERTDNQFILILATLAYLLAPVERNSEEIWENTSVVTASGDALDAIGRLLHVPRNNATPSRIPLHLILPEASSTDIVIPSQTKVTVDPLVTSDEYIFDEDVTINAGVTEIDCTAVNVRYGVTDSVPADTVTGIVDFPTITVENDVSVNGKNIEEDDDYRLRIQDWKQAICTGSEHNLTNYLSGLSNVADFRLIPLYNGAGSLKIICDAPSSDLAGIAEDVYENCMKNDSLSVRDPPPVVERPGTTTISSWDISISISSTSRKTEGEIIQLVTQQARTYISGGVNTNGKTIRGLGIGENFIPASMSRYLMEQIPELTNVIMEDYDEVTVPDYNKISITTLNVEVIE